MSLGARDEIILENNHISTQLSDIRTKMQRGLYDLSESSQQVNEEAGPLPLKIMNSNDL